MPRIEVEVNELYDPNPTRVSLVKHAANRTPFKIFKGDNEMSIDLGMAFSGLKNALSRKGDTAMKVAAIVVRKDHDFTEGQKVFEAQGYVFTEKSEKDGYILYTQPGVTGGKPAVLKFDDNTAMMVTNLHSLRSQVPVKKDFDYWRADATTFMDAMNTEGFYPSIAISIDSLRTCIFNVMDQCDSPEECAGLIETAIADFNSWVLGCVRAIPTQAFKAEIGYAKVHTANPGTTAAEAVGQLGADGNTSMAERQNDDTLIEAVTTNTEAATMAVKSAEVGDLTATVTKGADGKTTLVLKDADGKEIKFAVTKAEGAIGVQVSPETSKVNAGQAPSRIGGSGGTNAQVVGNSGETPIGTDTAKEPDPAEEGQAPDRTPGHGGANTQVVGNTAEAAIGTDEKAEPSKVNSSQGVSKEDILALMKTALGPLTEQVTKVQGDLGGLSTKVTTLDGRVKKAEEEINGTVVGTGEETIELSGSGQGRARKSEGAPPMLDTAFDRSHLRDRPSANLRRVS